MLDSQNNATLVPENALFRFKQNVQTGRSISTFSTFLSRFDASWTKYGFSEYFSWRKGFLYIHCKTAFLL